jgi:hypothetical protein
MEIEKIKRDRTYLNTTNTRDDTSEITQFSARIFHPSNNFPLNTALYTFNRVLTAVTYFPRMKIILILASSTAIVSRHDNALIHAPVIQSSVLFSMSQNWLLRRTTQNVFPIRILSRYLAPTKSQLSVLVLKLNKFRTVMSLFSNSQRNIRHCNQLPQPLSTIYLNSGT